MPKLSVIIPVFNVSKYIEKCARSLFDQTLGDIEYIFVNDCTPDDSIDVLRNVVMDYPDREPYVRIISHAENRGLPAARKTGIGAACGDYLAFCDSDDFVDLTMYEKMLSKAEEEGADIVFSDYYNVYEDGSRELIRTIRSDREIFGEILARRIPVSLCCRIFRRDLFSNGIVYPSANMGEDYALIVQLIFNATRIAYIDEGLYCYYQNRCSITGQREDSHIIKLFNDSIDNAGLLLRFLQSKGLTGKYKKEIVLLKHNMRNVLLLDFNAANRNLWLSTFPEINFIIPFVREIPLRERLKYILKALYIDRRSDE